MSEKYKVGLCRNRQFEFDNAVVICGKLSDCDEGQLSKDVKLLWKGSANQRVNDVRRSLSQPDPLTPVLHCGDYSEKYEIVRKVNNICGCCD